MHSFQELSEEHFFSNQNTWGLAMSAFLSFVAFYRKANGQTAANKCCSYQGLIYESVSVTLCFAETSWWIKSPWPMDIFSEVMWLQERLPDLRRFPWFQEISWIEERLWNMRWGGVKSLGEFRNCWNAGSFGRDGGEGMCGEVNSKSSQHCISISFLFLCFMYFHFLFVFVLHCTLISFLFFCCR